MAMAATQVMGNDVAIGIGGAKSSFSTAEAEKSSSINIVVNKIDCPLIEKIKKDNLLPR